MNSSLTNKSNLFEPPNFSELLKPSRFTTSISLRKYNLTLQKITIFSFNSSWWNIPNHNVFYIISTSWTVSRHSKYSNQSCSFQLLFIPQLASLYLFWILRSFNDKGDRNVRWWKWYEHTTTLASLCKCAIPLMRWSKTNIVSNQLQRFNEPVCRYVERPEVHLASVSYYSRKLRPGLV